MSGWMVEEHTTVCTVTPPVARSILSGLACYFVYYCCYSKQYIMTMYYCQGIDCLGLVTEGLGPVLI